MNEKIIGFDCRQITSDNAQNLWTEARRELFLLNKHVALPVSVDTNVMPSVFSFHEGLQAQQSVITVHACSSHQQDLGLWQSHKEMLGALIKHCEGKSVSKHNEIAITIVERDRWWNCLIGKEERLNEIEKDLIKPMLPGYWINLRKIWHSILEETTEPSKIEKTWTLMGYDIANGFLLSGLSNCGYGQGDIAVIRKEWLKHINDRGLFNNVDVALRFRDQTNKRVNEHAPFFVFGVYDLSPTKANQTMTPQP